MKTVWLCTDCARKILGSPFEEKTIGGVGPKTCAACGAIKECSLDGIHLINVQDCTPSDLLARPPESIAVNEADVHAVMDEHESDADLARLKQRRIGLPRKIADAFAIMEKVGRVIRMNVHAADFECMRTDGEDMFDSNPGDGGRMGHFWGADVFIDPTMHEGMMGLVGEIEHPDGSKGPGEVQLFTIG